MVVTCAHSLITREELLGGRSDRCIFEIVSNNFFKSSLKLTAGPQDGCCSHNRCDLISSQKICNNNSMMVTCSNVNAEAKRNPDVGSCCDVHEGREMDNGDGQQFELGCI